MGWFTAETPTLTPMDSVRSSVKAVLKTFVAERLERYPESELFFKRGLSRLVHGHRACEKALEYMEEDPQLFGELLASINASPYRNIQRMFCTLQHVAIHMQCLDEMEKLKGWFYLVGEGACDVYSQPFSVMEDYCADFKNNFEQETANKSSAIAARSIRIGMSGVCSALNCGPTHTIANLNLWTVLMSHMNISREFLDDERMTQFILEKEW